MKRLSTKTLRRIAIACSAVLATALSGHAEYTENNEKPQESRNVSHCGHYISGSVGCGAHSDIGFGKGPDEVNPWLKGNPNNGIGWVLDYYWLPCNEHNRRQIFGVGLKYAGNLAKGSDDVVIGPFLYHSPQKLLVNYLAPQAVMKILLGSGIWSVNVRAGVGVGQSVFSGSVSRIPQGDRNAEFRHTKYGFGFNLGAGIEARVSRHFSITLDMDFVYIFIKNPMRTPDIPLYDNLSNSNMGTSPFNLGIRYRF